MIEIPTCMHITIAGAIVYGVLDIGFEVNSTSNNNNNWNSLDGKLGVITAKDGLNVCGLYTHIVRKGSF